MKRSKNTGGLNHSRPLLLPILVCCLFTGPASIAKSSEWQNLNTAGENAYKRGEFAQAETAFRGAVKEAEKTDPKGQHFLFSLKRLAEVCKIQGKAADAEALLKCAQQIEFAQKIKKSSTANLQKSSISENKSQTENQKSSTQAIGRGGWDGNDLRINRRILY